MTDTSSLTELLSLIRDKHHTLSGLQDKFGSPDEARKQLAEGHYIAFGRHVGSDQGQAVILPEHWEVMAMDANEGRAECQEVSYTGVVALDRVVALSLIDGYQKNRRQRKPPPPESKVTGNTGGVWATRGKWARQETPVKKPSTKQASGVVEMNLAKTEKRKATEAAVKAAAEKLLVIFPDWKSEGVRFKKADVANAIKQGRNSLRLSDHNAIILGQMSEKDIENVLPGSLVFQPGRVPANNNCEFLLRKIQTATKSIR